VCEEMSKPHACYGNGQAAEHRRIETRSNCVYDGEVEIDTAGRGQVYICVSGTRGCAPSTSQSTRTGQTCLDLVAVSAAFASEGWGIKSTDEPSRARAPAPSDPARAKMTGRKVGRQAESIYPRVEQSLITEADPSAFTCDRRVMASPSPCRWKGRLTSGGHGKGTDAESKGWADPGRDEKEGQ